MLCFPLAVLLGGIITFIDLFNRYRASISFFRLRGFIDAQQESHAHDLVDQCEKEYDAHDIETAFQTCGALQTYLMESAGNPFLYDVRAWGDVYDEVYAKAMGDYFQREEIK